MRAAIWKIDSSASPDKEIEIASHELRHLANFIKGWVAILATRDSQEAVKRVGKDARCYLENR